MIVGRLDGRPTAMVLASSDTIAFTYDSRSRLVAVGGPTDAMRYSYNAFGRVTRVAMTDGSYYDISYDENHRTSRVARSDGSIISVASLQRATIRAVLALLGVRDSSAQVPVVPGMPWPTLVPGFPTPGQPSLPRGPYDKYDLPTRPGQPVWPDWLRRLLRRDQCASDESRDERERLCEELRQQDEARCVAIRHRYPQNPGARTVCLSAAMTRYSECLRFGPSGVTTPLPDRL